MGLICADLSGTLDGYIAGPNVAVGNGMGDGGIAHLRYVIPPGA